MSTPEPNPYEVVPFPDSVASPDDRSKPGPVAIAFSVILGLLIAAVVWQGTIFFTCVGLGYDFLDIVFNMSESDWWIIFTVAGVTGIAAFVLSVMGMLKLVRMFKR